MDFAQVNLPIKEVLKPEFNRMSAEARKLLDLEKNGDREVFLLCHKFANYASPIGGYIELRKPIEDILQVCEYAIGKLQDEDTLEIIKPIPTVHSQLFFTLQEEYLDILNTVKRKLAENKHLLEAPTPSA